MFKHKKNDDDGDLAELDELDADEKEGLFIDTSPAPETAAEPAAATAAATAPLDDDDVDLDEAAEPEQAAAEASDLAPAEEPASNEPTAGAVAEAQIVAAEAQTAAAKAQIAAAQAPGAAAQAPAGADPLEEDAADGGGALELDADEEESPQGEETEGDSDDDDADDADDALSAFRGPIKTSFASKLTKDIDDISMEDVVKEVREVRAMLPAIGADDSNGSAEG